MVYHNKFIMVVIVNNHFRKELANNTVPIPFNSEYTLRFRNKHNRRAVVKFYIDGENVSGNGYIIPANSYIDIERHHDTPKKFKFVSLDSEEAIDFGKNGSNPDKLKGVIEARFYLEKETPRPVAPPEVHHHHWHNYWNWPPPSPTRPHIWYRSNTLSLNGALNEALEERDGERIESINFGSTTQSDSSGLLRNRSLSRETTVNYTVQPTSLSLESLQDGCTVEGEVSYQTFRTESIELETDYACVKLFLQGYDPQEKRPGAPQIVKRKETASETSEPAETAPMTDAPPAEERNASLLEEENERLRRRIAELEENRRLKEKLAALEAEAHT